MAPRRPWAPALGLLVALSAVVFVFDARAQVPDAIAGPPAKGTSERPAILFGQSCALTGLSSALGVGMRNGILAAFKEANDAGGVQGFELQLVTLDDGYEPEPAVNNTRYVNTHAHTHTHTHKVSLSLSLSHYLSLTHTHTLSLSL